MSSVAVWTLVAVTVIGAFVEARADTIVVPNAYTATPAPGGGSKVPFSPNERWQQVYISQEFDSASGDILSISAMRFRIDEMTSFSNFSTVARGLSIFMATTTRTFATGSTVFAENAETPLFQALPLTDLPMSGSRTSATSFDVVVPLPNRYEYDRRTGNLLVEVRSVGGASIPFLDVEGMLPGTYAIAGALDSPIGTKGSGGFVTQFQFDVVPEPSTGWLLLAGAFVCLQFKKRR